MIARRVAVAIAAFLAAAGLVGEGRAAPFEYLPVAAVVIYPGDVIEEKMLAEQKFPSGTAATYPVVAARGELAGKVARRTLLPGKLIARNAVGQPDLVTRGSIVFALFEDGALRMSTTALALQSGSLGAGIQVRNVDSGKVIFGVVQADGTVRIGGR
ncbi:MAG: flagellar basal body P-ring formation chaperone FlgA [Bauldia sp.]|nr:flagellar basal body P-ring formation chaperone FlgA [Bauldia sp.]